MATKSNKSLERAIARGEVTVVNDPVNRPLHYTSGKIEVIDFIEDQELGFHLGNAVKYIARAGRKAAVSHEGYPMLIRDATVQDLQKARWYLDRHIANLQKK